MTSLESNLKILTLESREENEVENLYEDLKKIFSVRKVKRGRRVAANLNKNFP
jgi:hypothetical protein